MHEQAYRYRIYPNREQRHLIERTFGCCRWIWNRMMEERESAHAAGLHAPSRFEQDKELPRLKREHPWLAEPDSNALQQEVRDLDRAYQNFFRDPKHVGRPRFKSKRRGRQSYRTVNNNGTSIQVLDSKHVKLPKLGRVRARISREPLGRIASATVERVPDGRWFVSVLCLDVADETAPETDGAVGVDAGVKTLATLSDGTSFENPRAMKKKKKRLAREQKKLSRKKGARKGERPSKNYQKQKRRVARVHGRIADTRKDALHKASRRIVDENQVICVEDLAVAGMKRRPHMGGAVSDTGMGEFIRQLEYKSSWYGRELVKVDRFYPSSRTCSCCGNHQEMPLERRTYRCPVCGMEMDRDLNAARNILHEGLRMIGRGTPESDASPHKRTRYGCCEVAAARNACGEAFDRGLRRSRGLDDLVEARIPCL